VYDAIPLGRASVRNAPGLFIVRAEFTEGEPEGYALTLASAWGKDAIDRAITASPPPSLTLAMQKPDSKEAGLLYDATLDRATVGTLLEIMMHRRKHKGLHGELTGWSTADLDDLVAASFDLHNVPLRLEPRDGGVVIGDRLLFKLVRRAESGTHPDLEIGRYLNGCKGNCPPTLKVLGAVEYRSAGESATVGILQEYVPNTTPSWQYVQDALGRFFEHIMALPEGERPQSPPAGTLLELATGAASPRAQEFLGSILEWAGLLGRRTAELHLALIDRAKPDFAPETFSQLYQRSLYQSSRKMALRAFQQMRKLVKSLPEEGQALARAALEREKPILEQFGRIVGQKISAERIRCHGDFHLGHVLYTGKDFLIVDFDGDPGTSLSSRRVKRSPLADVAAMIHSLQSAASHSVLHLHKTGVIKPETAEMWRAAGDFWSQWVTSAFLRGYLTTEGVAAILPASGEPLARLLAYHLVQEAIEHLQKEMDYGGVEGVAVALERIVALPLG
jgi:maltose alpha-D-glucosyltransferase/alpha-amylase